jgi:CxxC motif-containing protein
MAVTKNGNALGCVSKKNGSSAFAVRQYGWSLEYASDELKNNKHVVLHAIAQAGGSLKFASIKIQKEIFVKLLKKVNLHF